MVKTLDLSLSKRIGFFIGPLLFTLIYIFFPSDVISPNAYKVLALAAWMISWWITEAAPIPITALLPIVFLPALGVLSLDEASTQYANPSIFLFMGGFMIAIALEKHKLHERIALNLIRITGTSGNGIILGFTLSTAFLSMWISNTATALMMLPIAVSVIELLRRKDSEAGIQISKGEKYFALGLMLSVGYSANIGGMATLIGTPPNVVFISFVRQFYHQEISFFQWLIVGVPVSALTLACMYIILTKILFPNHLSKIEGSKDLINNKLLMLGKMGKEEKLVLLVFGLTSFFWIFQQAFNSVLQQKVFNDTNIAMAGGLLMFLIPVDIGKKVFLLNWEDTKRLPWGILILFGGGICLAKGMEASEIIKSLGDSIASQHHLEFWQLTLLLITLSIILTEFMSNVALVTIFVPVVFAIANGMGYNPLLLAMPVTFAASCAFMFPISTPPNAIVFASGHIKMKEMMRAGILLNIMAILILWLLSSTLLSWVLA
jgi:sodium-dependent dicarboxylate transporter 2/3/5